MLLIHMPQTLQTRDSFVQGPGQGVAKSGPKDITDMEKVLQSLSRKRISSQAKIDIMQQALQNTPKSAFPVKGSKYHHCWQ